MDDVTCPVCGSRMRVRVDTDSRHTLPVEVRLLCDNRACHYNAVGFGKSEVEAMKAATYECVRTAERLGRS